MYTMREFLHQELALLQQQGLYKKERLIQSPQGAQVTVSPDLQVLNFCSNNYLGLANDSDLITTTKNTLHEFGFGMASVRFICGTQTIHKTLEQHISQFLGTEDAILYSSCFDANTGLFETLLGPEDAVISDELNHASIIDGIRLCRAKRYRYKNREMVDLEAKLQEAVREGARFKLIVTDGVFSMDGAIANLSGICELAEKYQAMVMVDDSHAVGILGPQGQGTPAYFDVREQVDIITGTLGKALGGASGGYTAGPKEIIAWLRNRSRPYLFSNTLMPLIAATTLQVIDRVRSAEGDRLRQHLFDNVTYFRNGISQLGLPTLPGEHPIIPIMLGDAKIVVEMADRLLQEGIYVIGFSYPVVPLGKARIRVQLSAAHTRDHLDQALTAFSKVAQSMRII